MSGGMIGVLFFDGFSDIAPSEMFRTMIFATVFVLILGGGEIAFSFLFTAEKFGVHKLACVGGGIVAVGLAFVYIEQISSLLERFSEDEPECVTEVSFTIGPVTFSEEKCEE